MTGVVLYARYNMQDTTIFEPVILTDFYTISIISNYKFISPPHTFFPLRVVVVSLQ